MSGFKEMMKNFNPVRDYMRDFYVYGFKSRQKLAIKSLRTYDNEKRRIESYVGEFMSFYQDEKGKNIFLSVDSASIAENPLYRAFKAKSFTKNDITLHFMILDLLQDGKKRTAAELTDSVYDQYLFCFESPLILDAATVRNKLKEYVGLGLLQEEKSGKSLYYYLVENHLKMGQWKEAVAYFSEASPIGVVGSYIMDWMDWGNPFFCFKHHYIVHAMESEIISIILGAMEKQKNVEIISQNSRSRQVVTTEVAPLKFLISVQGGRQYLSAYSLKAKAIMNFRLDFIKAVKELNREETQYQDYATRLNQILQYTWGASFGKGEHLESLSMELLIKEGEEYIIKRLESEGRHGVLTRREKHIYEYAIEVYDAMELVPWLRTFIGRILSLQCTNGMIKRRFYGDLNRMYEMYGVGYGGKEGKDRAF